MQQNFVPVYSTLGICLTCSGLEVRSPVQSSLFHILYVTQSRSQSFVPLDQRSENESSGNIHFEITMANNRILVIRFTAQSQSASISCYGACLKWLLPELSFSDRWSRGTKLWERDCCVTLKRICAYRKIFLNNFLVCHSYLLLLLS